MIDAGIDEQRRQCEGSRDKLLDLARIHLEIDAPKRRIGADGPDWIFRLRKVCLHAVALSNWDVSVENVHAMATELRAAYVQIAAVWECLPEEFRRDEIEGSWWANEARSGVLARFDHPTPFQLAHPLSEGGFGEDEDPESYLRMAMWLGQLGFGYGMALAYLAQFLGAQGDITSRVAATMEGLIEP